MQVAVASEPLPEKLFTIQPPQANLYRVKSGDTLSGIARKFATSTALLLEINDMDKPSTLRVGQDLRVPAGKEAAVATDKRLAQAEERSAPGSVPLAAATVSGAL